MIASWMCVLKMVDSKGCLIPRLKEEDGRQPTTTTPPPHELEVNIGKSRDSYDE